MYIFLLFKAKHRSFYFTMFPSSDKLLLSLNLIHSVIILMEFNVASRMRRLDTGVAIGALHPNTAHIRVKLLC